ncbi:hypothetical protein PM082_013314 [Marasmius tenuissimus]|nr:hypothetical protein PM082_013314 [Marasmius tenuissimus]
MSSKSQKQALWSKKLDETQADSEIDSWGVKRSTALSLDGLEVEKFNVKRRKKGWQDQSPSKKSSMKTSSQRKCAAGKERPPQGSMRAEQAQMVPTASCEMTSDLGLGGGSGDFVDDMGGFGHSPTPTEGSSEEEVERYLQEFQEGRAGFYHIGTFVFIVQGWDKRQMAPTDNWYHFRAQKVGSDVDLDCRCPDGRRARTCVHKDCYREFRKEYFSRLESDTSAESLVVLFRRERVSELNAEATLWLNMFSVQEEKSHESELDKRAVVLFISTDDGRGDWRCSSNRHAKWSSCEHRKMAIKSFRMFNARVTAEGSDFGDVNSDWDDTLENFGDGDAIGDRVEMAVVEPVNGNQGLERSISYLPIRPPEWISLQSDTAHYPRTSPKNSVPNTIDLRGGGRSGCNTRLSPALEGTERILKECKVYTVTEELHWHIEVVHCPTCHPRKNCFIGPDA